jgi:hypothetical protein
MSNSVPFSKPSIVHRRDDFPSGSFSTAFIAGVGTFVVSVFESSGVPVTGFFFDNVPRLK